MAEALAATRRAVARAAFRIENGNISRAASLIGVSQHTLHRALEELDTDTMGMWQHRPKHAPFDDQLFPFIRTLWPATPDAAWAQEYAAWMIETIVPRAISESKKIVVLENCAQMYRLPPVSSLPHLRTLNDTAGPVAAPHGAGVVFYAPNVPIAGWLAPIINMVPISVKFATTPERVAEFATLLFESVGAAVPPKISLD